MVLSTEALAGAVSFIGSAGALVAVDSVRKWSVVLIGFTAFYS